MKKDLMKKIKSGEIKMKPKWEFRLKEWGKEGVSLAIMALAGVATTAIYYFIKVYDPREWLAFGDLGWEIFLTDFPYYWLGLNVFLVIAGIWLWSRVGQNYRKTWGRLIAGVIGGVMLLSIGLVLLQGQ